MPKFHGKIGYVIPTETSPGVWEEVIVEREYFGDVVKNTRGLQSANQVNDNVIISNEISIVADPFANENFHAILYVEFMDSKWKVSNITVSYPRLVMAVGGLYNG